MTFHKRTHIYSIQSTKRKNSTFVFASGWTKAAELIVYDMDNLLILKSDGRLGTTNQKVYCKKKIFFLY
jgi:hypothetical protein